MLLDTHPLLTTLRAHSKASRLTFDAGPHPIAALPQQAVDAEMFTAAEMLALRTMPQGDRRWRTSWWHGFCSGIEKKLASEHRSVVRESPGSGLVLLERTERAQKIGRAHV